jgi:hypothetical protein
VTQSSKARLVRASILATRLALVLLCLGAARSAAAGVSIASDLASPRIAGTTISWTATMSGGTAPYTFKWLVSPDNGATWQHMTSWSSSTTFQWTPQTGSSNYLVGVWVRYAGNASENQDDATTRPYVIGSASGPAALQSISSDFASPRVSGTTITWTATAAAGAQPSSYKWWVSSNNGASWQAMTGWSTSNTFQWTPQTASNAYLVGAWIRNANNTSENYDDATTRPYAIVAPSATAGVWLTADRSSPQATGPIVFDAHGINGTPPYSYKFFVSSDNGSNWTIVRDWGTSPTYQWVPGLPSSYYLVSAWIRSANNSTDNREDGTSMPFVITQGSPAAHVSLSANKSSPQPGGSVVRFTASPSGGIGPHSYKFFVSSNGGQTWSLARGWETSPLFDWLPTAANSSYVVAAQIRSSYNSSDDYEDGTSFPFSISSAPAHINALTPSVPSPQPTGTSITWTATGGGGTPPYSYKFMLSSNNGKSWSTVRDWATTNTFVWQPTVKYWGYRMAVWIRSSLNTTDMKEDGTQVLYETSSAVAPPNSVIWDTFTATGNLDGRAPEIRQYTNMVWTRLEGTASPTLNGNRVVAPTGVPPGNIVEIVDSLRSNGQVAVDFKTTSTSRWAGLILRAQDANNMLLLRYVGTETTGRLELLKRVNGVSQLPIQWVDVGPQANGSTHRIEAHLYGQSITARFDGRSVFEVPVSDYVSATKHGVMWDLSIGSATQYDEFQVGDNPYVSTLPAGTRCEAILTRQVILVYADSDTAAGRLDVSMPSPACAYTVGLLDDYYTYATLDGPEIGNGKGTVGFLFNAFDENPHISFASVAGHLVVLSQASTAGYECGFSMSVPELEYPFSGGTASVTVTPTHSTCPWAALTDSPHWITLSDGSIRTSQGSINVSVGPNPTINPRNGFLTLGTYREFSIEQFGNGTSGGGGGGENPEGDPGQVDGAPDTVTVLYSSQNEMQGLQEKVLVRGYNLREQNKRLTVIPVDQFGRRTRFVGLRIEATMDSAPGGHLQVLGKHSTPPAVPAWPSNSTTCNTGSSGECDITMGTGNVGGKKQIRFLVESVNGFFVTPYALNTVLEVYLSVDSGRTLDPLYPSTLYKFIGDSDWHPSNHWGRSSFNQKLTNLANLYSAAYPSFEKLCINDMSLPRGGKFDVDGSYTGSHESHQTGQDADIKTLSHATSPCMSGIPWQQPGVRSWLSMNLAAVFGH